MKDGFPNFIVIGAAKAGTTSLFEYLQTHPEVYLPGEKELSFFVDQYNWRNGVEWYRSRFQDAGSAKAVGEVSPAYAYFPSLRGVPERMLGLLPAVRLVYLVRHPIERIRSMYLHARLIGNEDRSLTRAVLESREYVDVSSYATQLGRYLPYIDRDRILVVASESLRDQRQATMARVFDFIGVDPSWVPPNLSTEFYVSGDQVPDVPAVVPPPLARFLATTLRPEVSGIAAWLGPGFDGWGLL